MGRTRTTTRSARVLKAAGAAPAPAAPPARPAPSIPALVDKAQALIVQCDYDLAARFIRRILDHSPDHAVAREMLGVVRLETGELDAAKQIFESLLPPSPTAPSPPPHSAHLYLAQLSEDDPHLALRHYQSALDLLHVQLKGKERAAAPTPEDDEAEIRKTIVRALIGMVEIWMDPSYDLCFDPAAEKTCEDLLTTAMQTDPGNPEALQMLASVRMSQSRPDDAKAAALQAWEKWKDLDPASDAGDVALPAIPTRLALVRLFLELGLWTAALSVLQGIMAADDQEVEAWYLEGWCFYLMAEQAREGKEVEGLGWEELARDARDCLETCCGLHTSQEHPDTPLLEHAQELIVNLDTLGVHSTPEGEDDDDGEDAEGWEDTDSGDDAEMEVT